MSARYWVSPRRFIGWAFAALLVLVGISIAASLIAFAFRGSGTQTGFFPFGFGWFFVFLLFLFFWGSRWWGGWGRSGRPYWHHAEDGAKGILRERYARGEIRKDQFDQMMRDLGERK